jgi:hypothetical protein
MEQQDQPGTCSACGAQSFPGDIFCRECGEKLLPRCTQCGAVIDTPSKFCHQCGNKLEPQPQPSDKSVEPQRPQEIQEPQDIQNAQETQEPEPLPYIPPETSGTYNDYKQPKRKSPLGIIAIGATIVILLAVLVIGILFILDFVGSGTSTAVPPDSQITKQEPEQKESISKAPPVITAFIIDPSKITTAESTMATWEVTGADTVSIDHGIGEVAPTGSMSLSPAQSTVYRLTATNEGGNVTRTAEITVISNVNAKDIALKPEEAGQDGYQFHYDMAPSMEDTISTYHANFKLGTESMGNLVAIYTTVSKAVNSFYEIKSNHRENVTDIVDIGDRAYYSTIIEYMPDETEMYTICFQKNNVYVNIGQASDLDRILEYARLVESRIQ